MADWGNTTSGGDVWGSAEPAGAFDDGAAGTSCFSCGQTDHAGDACPNGGNGEAGLCKAGGNDKCFGCGEEGHRRSECPNAEDMTCRYCQQRGHMIKDCPDKGPMMCDNCGEEGHMKYSCEKPRKVNRDHVADVDADVAWEKIKQGVAERDIDDVKEGVAEYVKALDGAVTYREMQEALIDQGTNLWFIGTERALVGAFTNMDLQGNMSKTYTVSYRFSEKPERPIEIEGWPKTREEILSRLDDAGDVVATGKSRCHNCNEFGHMSKDCAQEKIENTDAKKVCCSNCNEDGHRLRDCPIPRIDKFACKNCGKSGHKIADCEDPPNLDNVGCRKCNEMGHFSRDCPQGGGRACRNCGQEGHMAKECDQPQNLEMVTCRNCDQTGHFSRDCPLPRDYSKVQCSSCSEFGHTKVRCKKTPADMDGTKPNFGMAYPADQSEGTFWGAGNDTGASAADNGWGQAVTGGGDW